MGDELVYETELFGQIAQSDSDRRFFASLDSQLNKVNEFYRNKEEEFVQYEMLLEKQIFALTGVKKLLKQNLAKQILMEAQQYSTILPSHPSIGKCTVFRYEIVSPPLVFQAFQSGCCTQRSRGQPSLISLVLFENGTAHISFQDILLINPTYFDIVSHIVQIEGTPVQAYQSQVTLIRMMS
jgi:hypothetical protein